MNIHMPIVCNSNAESEFDGALVLRFLPAGSYELEADLTITVGKRDPNFDVLSKISRNDTLILTLQETVAPN